MPRSKRHRVKSMSNIVKKQKDSKLTIIESIRNSIDNYANLFVFSFTDMRTNHFKRVRMDFKDDSRFYLGKNKVMIKAFGRTKEEEYATNISEIIKNINGNVGILFTNKTLHDVQNYFNTLNIKDYARSGFIATETIHLKQGPLPQFVGSMVEMLRSLGLPVDLKKGVIHLTQDYTICEKNKRLTPEQAKLLIHFDKKMANFKLDLVSQWTNGTFISLTEPEKDIEKNEDKMEIINE